MTAELTHHFHILDGSLEINVTNIHSKVITCHLKPIPSKAFRVFYWWSGKTLPKTTPTVWEGWIRCEYCILPSLFRFQRDPDFTVTRGDVYQCHAEIIYKTRSFDSADTSIQIGTRSNMSDETGFTVETSTNGAEAVYPSIYSLYWGVFVGLPFVKATHLENVYWLWFFNIRTNIVM